MKLQTGIYNRAVYWTDELESKVKKAMTIRYTVSATKHYKFKARKLGLPLGCYKAMLYGKIVEVEYDKQTDVVQKIITRLPNRVKDGTDICAAIRFDGYEAYVVTVWLNKATDNHKTIRVENYVNEVRV